MRLRIVDRPAFSQLFGGRILLQRWTLFWWTLEGWRYWGEKDRHDKISKATELAERLTASGKPIAEFRRSAAPSDGSLSVVDQ